ncbi:MAG: PAS domain S-box protein [Methanobacterium sp. ERen5]|nr:MAG: PAS domain S-box protein [Methanobacterium sp. ERen5]
MNTKILMVGRRSKEAEDYKSFLNSMGYELLSCSKGLESIKKLAELKLDLILIDIGFDNRVHGMNLADQIHHDLKIPILIILNDPESFDDEFFKHQGIYGYLTKPIKALDLKINVKLALQRKQHEKAIEERNKELTKNFTKSKPIIGDGFTRFKNSEHMGMKSEEMYRQIVETTNEGIALADRNLNLVYVNPRLCELFGYDEEEFIGKSPLEFLDKSQSDSLFKAKKQLLSGKNVSMVCKWRKKDHSPFWTLSKNSLLFDDEGNFQGLLSMHSDVTSLEQAKEKLQRSEKRFKDLIETNPDFIWEIDTQGKFTYCSPQVESMSGFKPEDMIGKKPFDFMHPDNGKAAYENYIQNLDNPRDFQSHEMKVCNNEGTLKFLDVHSTPIFDENGTLIGYRGISRDISASMEAQKALQESNNRFKLMANGTSGLIFVTNERGEHLFMNDSYLEFFGVTEEQINGTKWQPAIHPEDRSKYLKNVENALNNHLSFRDQVRVRRGDGEWIWIETSATPRFSADNKYLGHVGISIDIHDHKKAEKKEKLLTKQLQLALNAADMGWGHYNPRKDISTYDERCGEIFGLERNESSNTEILKLIHPEDQPKVIEKLEITLDSKSSRIDPIEYRIFRGDEIRWIESYCLATFDENEKQANNFMGTVSDITERKKMEEKITKINEALEESEEQLRLFIENVPTAIAMFDNEMNYISVSKFWISNYGLEDKEIIGKSHYKVFPNLNEEWKQAHKQGLKGTAVCKEEDKYVHLDGTIQWVRWEVIPWYTSSNTIGGIIIFSEDITKIKLANESLKENKQFLESIIENIPSMIFVKSADNLKYEIVNEATENVWGHDRQNLIGKTDYEFLPEKEAHMSTKLNKNVLDKKEIRDFPEQTIQTKNCGERIFHTKKIPLLNDKGIATHLLGISEDITDSIIAERKLKGSLKEKDVLMREIYHRVKNNMQIIASLLSLQIEHVGDEKSKAILRDSQSRVKTMAMIHEKLYMSQDLSNINFKGYVDNLMSNIIFTYGVDKNKIQIDLDVDNVNLNMETAIPVGLIINEIVVNSIKYAFPEGSEKLL